MRVPWHGVMIVDLVQFLGFRVIVFRVLKAAERQYPVLESVDVQCRQRDDVIFKVEVCGTSVSSKQTQQSKETKVSGAERRKTRATITPRAKQKIDRNKQTYASTPPIPVVFQRPCNTLRILAGFPHSHPSPRQLCAADPTAVHPPLWFPD